MRENCDKYGVKGELTYQPPNIWDPVLEAFRDAPAPPYYGTVVVTHSPPAFPLDPLVIKRELDFLSDLQARLRVDAEPLITKEKEMFGFVFHRLLGLDKATTPQSTSMIEGLLEFSRFHILRAKQRLNRPRPVQLRPGLLPPFCPGHPAYPSGHAGQSHLIALAFVEALPDNPEWHPVLLNTAFAIGFRREIAGVHYPSDSAAGREFARGLLADLKADPDGLFIGKIGAVRKELAALFLGRKPTDKGAPASGGENRPE